MNKQLSILVKWTITLGFKQIKEVVGYQYESIEGLVTVIAINMYKIKKMYC